MKDLVKNKAVIGVAGVLVGHFFPAVYPWFQVAVSALNALGS